jgi:hypothetical protein
MDRSTNFERHLTACLAASLIVGFGCSTPGEPSGTASGDSTPGNTGGAPSSSSSTGSGAGGHPPAVAPIEVAPGTCIGRFVLTDADAYFIDMDPMPNATRPYSIKKAPLSGAREPTVVTSLRPADWARTLDLGDIELGAGKIYWTQYNSPQGFIAPSVMEASVAGGPSTVLERAAEFYSEVAIDASNLYITNPTGLVSRRLSDGVETTLLEGLFRGALAVDATNVYYLEPVGFDTHLMALPLAGGAPKELDVAGSGRSRIRLDNDTLYWLSGGRLRRVSLSTGEATPIPMPLPNVVDFAVDESYVYWLDGGTGCLSAAARDGGAPIDLACDQFLVGYGDAARIEVDATDIYFTNDCARHSLDSLTKGRLFKLKKPGVAP